jgi:hypothetical protein
MDIYKGGFMRIKAAALVFIALLVASTIPAPTADAQFYECPEPGPCCFCSEGGSGGGHDFYCTYYYTDAPYNTELVIEC